MPKKQKNDDSAQPRPKLYITLAGEGTAELTEKKSRFIGYAAPTKTIDEAEAFIAKIKARHTDATHNVWAYLMHGTGIARCSDDGEPQGTAGLPVLDVIRKSGFADAVIVVTRYFGGTLLGAGGLVRAYSAAAKSAADTAKIVTYENFTEFTVRCSYSEYQKLEYELPRLAVKQDGVDFGDTVTLRLAVRETMFPALADHLAERRIVAVVTGTRFDS